MGFGEEILLCEGGEALALEQPGLECPENREKDFLPKPSLTLSPSTCPGECPCLLPLCLQLQLNPGLKFTFPWTESALIPRFLFNVFYL